MTPKKKILVGCLAAVGAMILAVILSVFFFVTWIKSPSPELDGNRLVEPDTLIYAEVRLREEDQAVRQLLRTFVATRNQAGLEQFQSAEFQQIPSFVRQFLPMFQNMGGGTVKDEDLDKLLPVAGFLTSSLHDESGLSPLLAVSFPASGHVLSLLDWILRRTAGNDSDLQQQQHGEESLYKLKKTDTGWFSIVETDVLFALDQSALLGGIETLARTQPPPSPPALVSLLAGAPEDTALRLAAVGEGAANLPDLISPWVPGLADLFRERLAGAGSIVGWARLESEERLAGVLFVTPIEPAGPEDTGLSRYTLEFLDGSMSFVLADGGLQPDGRRRWDFTLEGVEALVVLAARQVTGRDGIVIGP